MITRNTVLIAILCLIFGFVAAYIIYGKSDTVGYTEAEDSVLKTDRSSESTVTNPFRPLHADIRKSGGGNDERLDRVEDDITLIKQQLLRIEDMLEKTTTTAAMTVSSRSIDASSRPYSALDRRLYKLENLIKGGVDPTIADDFVRKKNSIELKRLELQDRAKRSKYLNTQQYYDELESIDQLDVSLREVLGDDQYDAYLFNSKQNNRIRIASVMLGSSAERAGIQKGDVVLSYDNSRMFRWQELKNATTEGQLGDLVSIYIYRDGEIYSFSIPRGPLGVQLGATRLQP